MEEKNEQQNVENKVVENKVVEMDKLVQAQIDCYKAKTRQENAWGALGWGLLALCTISTIFGIYNETTK